MIEPEDITHLLQPDDLKAFDENGSLLYRTDCEYLSLNANKLRQKGPKDQFTFRGEYDHFAPENWDYQWLSTTTKPPKITGDKDSPAMIFHEGICLPYYILSDLIKNKPVVIVKSYSEKDGKRIIEPTKIANPVFAFNNDKNTATLIPLILIHCDAIGVIEGTTYMEKFGKLERSLYAKPNRQDFKHLH